MTGIGARPCPLCAEAVSRLFLETGIPSASGKTFRVLSCTSCSLRFTDPLPTAEELNRLYEDEYYEYAYDGPTAERNRGEYRSAARKPGRFSLSFLTLLFKSVLFAERRRALLGRKPGRVLDVGCGNGDFLQGLKRRGWDAYGVEFSESAAELARAKGIIVHNGELASAGFADGFFDVVTLWHVVEHLPQPLTELAEVHRILREDGLLVLEVPNNDCLTRRLCGARWMQFDIPRHLQHFTSATLEHALAETAFLPVHHRNLHYFDFNLVFYNLMERLNVSRLSGIRYFSMDFNRASRGSKALFLALGIPLAGLSVLYSVLEVKLGGNGENLTITAQKAGG